MPDKSAVQPAAPPLEICFEECGNGDWRGSFSLTSAQMEALRMGSVPLPDGTKVYLSQKGGCHLTDLKVRNQRLEQEREFWGIVDPRLPYQRSEQNFCQHPDGCDCKL